MHEKPYWFPLVRDWYPGILCKIAIRGAPSYEGREPV